jgi:hydrogenase maturation protease
LSLLIGYGNTLCGDDGVGVYAADTLLKEGLPSHVDVITARQLYPEMAEAISRATCVVFVDARADGVPGEVMHQCLEPGKENGPLIHHAQPDQLLRLAAVLYGCCPPAHLVTITGQDFAIGSGFSVPVNTHLPHLIDTVRRLLR